MINVCGYRRPSSPPRPDERFTSCICYRSPPAPCPLGTAYLHAHRTPLGTIRLRRRKRGRNIRLMMLPNFPWLAAAAAAAAASGGASASGNVFPWRPPGIEGWHHLLAGIEMKKEDGHTDASDGTDCVVCGDKSSGKHYGQFSCEGCKSFFKRSIRRSLSYTCRAAKNCAIDVQHRNQCQYCRLKKCIRMGMRKEGRRSHETAVSAVQRGRLPVQMPPFFPPNPFFRPFSFPMFNPMMAAQLTTKPLGKESIFEFAAQTIFATVNWARSSTANLPKRDQLSLLRHSWTPIFVFALAHSTFAPNLASHLTENGSKSEDEKDGVGAPDSGELQTKLDAIREYHLDIVEVSSLRAILLFNYEEEQLEEDAKTKEIVVKLTGALEEYCKMNKAPERFESLQECLRLLESTRSLPISRLFFSRLLGATPLESILSDLLSTPPPALPLFPTAR